MRRTLVLVLVLAAAWSGCSRKKRVRAVPPPVPTPPAVGTVETGVASWYGHPYHGRPSASGEVYDMEQLTAAHRTLPFNTWVKVDDLDTGKSVEVRINDRGPFVDGRIIDLSHAAARTIDMIGPGTARVKLEVIRMPQAAPGRFAVQVGAYRDRRNAERVEEEMRHRYGSARTVEREGNPRVWRVLVGQEPTEDGAAALAGRIRAEGGERGSAFVVRVDL